MPHKPGRGAWDGMGNQAGKRIRRGPHFSGGFDLRECTASSCGRRSQETERTASPPETPRLPPGPGRRSSGALPRQSTSTGSLAAVSYICNGEISYSLPGNWEKLRRTAIFCGDLLCDSPTGCDPIVAEQTLPRHTTLARTSAVVRHDMSTVITMTSAAL